MSDDFPKKMTNPLGRMTARDALVYAAGEEHWNCTVIAKGKVRDSNSNKVGTISFKCACNITYVIKATKDHKDALRNILEDKKL